MITNILLSLLLFVVFVVVVRLRFKIVSLYDNEDKENEYQKPYNIVLL